MDADSSSKQATPIVGLEVRLKDLPIDKTSKEAKEYRSSQLLLDRGILQRLLRQEARAQEVQPHFKLQWGDLQSGERARLWALAVMAEKADLDEREWELLNRLIPPTIPLEGAAAEEFFRGLRGIGIVGQEEAVRAYLKRLMTPPNPN
jgi:hypothetical protein